MNQGKRKYRSCVSRFMLKTFVLRAVLNMLVIEKKGPGELVKKIDAQLFESGYYTSSAFLKTTGLIVASGHKGAFLRVTSNGNIYESRAAFILYSTERSIAVL